MADVELTKEDVALVRAMLGNVASLAGALAALVDGIARDVEAGDLSVGLGGVVDEAKAWLVASAQLARVQREHLARVVARELATKKGDGDAG